MLLKKNTVICVSLLLLSLMLSGLMLPIATAAAADKRIVVLDFELKDLTPSPNTPAEMARTASVAPLLREALAGKSGFAVVGIDPAAQSAADKGAGYLYDQTEVAARLGEQAGADYIAVGRVHKPSFLFAYLKVHLVDVKKKLLIGDFTVEVKGAVKKITQRGVGHLADKIEQTLNTGSS